MDERSSDSDWPGYLAGGDPAQPDYGDPAQPDYGDPAQPDYGDPAQPDYGEAELRHRRLAGLIIFIAVAALAAAGGGLVVALLSSSGGGPSRATAGLGPGSTGGSGIPGSGAGTGPGAGTGAGSGISSATMRRIEKSVEPGVVVINSKLDDDPDATGAAGTGMIISKSGLVLTNNHVINATNGLTATVVWTGKTYPAKWLGYDKGSDVAVIQIEGASGLTPVRRGNSSAVRVGEDVVAMGNAGGTGTITTATGSITGLDQAITASDDTNGESPEHLTGMLQTDAAIVRGDSGGPLASTSGEVIGMDTAASSDTMTSQQGAGFAIPIDTAMKIARQIIAGKPGPGIRIGAAGFAGVLVPAGVSGNQSTASSPRVQLQQTKESSPRQPFGGGPYPAPAGCLPNAGSSGVPQHIAPVTAGALVLGALCQTPAAAAGLAAGDVITGVAGQHVSSPASLTSILSQLPSGKQISITWVTPSGQAITRAITLAQAPPQ